MGWKGDGRSYILSVLLFACEVVGFTSLQRNIFENELEICSTDPLTGWYRDGFCKTDENDLGLHTVCTEMTTEFLEFTKAQGNDLSTPSRHFPGLKLGDKWCICVERWEEARRAGFAPRVKLSATNKMALKVAKLEDLQFHRTNVSEANLSATILNVQKRRRPLSVEL